MAPQLSSGIVVHRAVPPSAGVSIAQDSSMRSDGTACKSTKAFLMTSTVSCCQFGTKVRI